jgi:pyruvate/2-oxoglutarate/acetoin dehydrogenase E1 component
MRTASFRQALNEALLLEMERDERVVIIGEDVAGAPGVEGFEQRGAWGGPFAVTSGLTEKFGRQRVLDSPLSESGFLGAAVGAAMTGLRPVVEIQFSEFFGVCFDQIQNQASKIRYMTGGQVSVPLVIRTTIGAGFGAGAHHSGSPYSLFAHIPGLKVVVPGAPADAKGLLTAAIRDDNPVVFFEHKALYSAKGTLPAGELVTPLGAADIRRRGDHVTVVAVGAMVQVALEAAAALSAADGIDIEVVDPRTLYPLDIGLIAESVTKTGRLIVVDEDNPVCSFGSEIISVVARDFFTSLQAAPRLISPPHTPVPFSSALESLYVPTASAVVEAARILHTRS